MQVPTTIILAALLLASSGRAQEEAEQEADPTVELFAAKCASCHTVGKGVRVGPDLAGAHERRARAWLQQTTQTPSRLLSRDATARQLLLEFDNVRMPDLCMSEEQAESLIELIVRCSAEPCEASLLLAGLATPLVVSVHTIVSFDFATSLIPGWHTTIFPPYFVTGAVFSGFAMVLTLLIVTRRVMSLERYITARHLDTIRFSPAHGPDALLLHVAPIIGMDASVLAEPDTELRRALRRSHVGVGEEEPEHTLPRRYGRSRRKVARQFFDGVALCRSISRIPGLGDPRNRGAHRGRRALVLETRGKPVRGLKESMMNRIFSLQDVTRIRGWRPNASRLRVIAQRDWAVRAQNLVFSGFCDATSFGTHLAR